MRLVSITRVLDEADIIESFVRHTSAYVEQMIFVDNGSRDGTLDILQALIEEGFAILVYQNKSVSYQELSFNTTMYKDAIDLFGADWVLCLDSDEFIDDAEVEGGLIAALERFDVESGVLTVAVPLFEYRKSAFDDPDEVNIPLRIRHRLAPFGVHKVFVSRALAALDPVIGGGNHFAYVDGKRVAQSTEPGLRLAHFPERSTDQLVAKLIKGWGKVLASGPAAVALDISSHYRDPFWVLRDTPEKLLRNASFVERVEWREMVEDALLYRGGPLVFTKTIDETMRSVRMMIGYFEDLATRYGYLLENCPEAAAIIEDWDHHLTVRLGRDRSASRMRETRPEFAIPNARRLEALSELTRAARLAKTPIVSSRDGLGPTPEARRGPRTIHAALIGCLRRNFGVGQANWRTRVAREISQRLAEGRFGEADTILADALADFPSDPLLLRLHAFSAHSSGRYQIAVERWQRSIWATPDDPMGHAGLACNYRELGKLALAADAIDIAMTRFPSDAAVLTEAARIAAARLRFNEAIDLTEKAIVLFGPLTELMKFKHEMVERRDAIPFH